MPEEPKDPNDELNEDNDEPGDFHPEDYFNDSEWEDDDDEDDEKMIKEDLENENKRIHDMPLYKSAVNIRKLTMALAETIKEEDDELMMKDQMLANAYMLGPKIAGAEGGDFYTLRMENAVIIKIHARDLLTQTSYCRIEKLTNPDYLKLLRDEIENFRKLFVEWVNSFDRTNDIQDDWGLFY